MSEQDQSKGFYEQRGMVRHMIVLPEQSKAALKEIAKTHGITQGEVVEVLLNQMDSALLAQHFEAKRSSKVGIRTAKSDLANKLLNLSAAQLAAITAIIDAGA